MAGGLHPESLLTYLVKPLGPVQGSPLQWASVKQGEGSETSSALPRLLSLPHPLFSDL